MRFHCVGSKLKLGCKNLNLATSKSKRLRSTWLRVWSSSLISAKVLSMRMRTSRADPLTYAAISWTRATSICTFCTEWLIILWSDSSLWNDELLLRSIASGCSLTNAVCCSGLITDMGKSRGKLTILVGCKAMASLGDRGKLTATVWTKPGLTFFNEKNKKYTRMP